MYYKETSIKQEINSILPNDQVRLFKMFSKPKLIIKQDFMVKTYEIRFFPKTSSSF